MYIHIYVFQGFLGVGEMKKTHDNVSPQIITGNNQDEDAVVMTKLSTTWGGEQGDKTTVDANGNKKQNDAHSEINEFNNLNNEHSEPSSEPNGNEISKNGHNETTSNSHEDLGRDVSNQMFRFP